MRFRTLALCSTSLFVAFPALAQTAPATPGAPATEVAAGEEALGEEIVVTGLRESLASAQGLKRNSIRVVDAVIAEDIGKLPDLSVSDTAARIPGVQVYRQGGEAARVLVRGLPDFVTTYNGREIFTAETRVVALQDFPSANIAALEVFKTSTADLVEPGLAGVVNVRSRRPFDFQDGQVAGTVWGLFTRQAKEVTPNFNLLATKRWETGIGEVGVLVNGSYTELQYLDSEPSNTDFLADPVINGQRVRFPDVQRLFYRSGNRVRPSVNAALQWKPTPDLEIYAEGLWQGFRNKIDDRLVAAPLYGGRSYTNLVFREGTNLLRSGTVVAPGDPIFTFQGGTYNKTDTYQFAGGFRYDSGQFKLSGDVSRTRSTFTGSTESVDRIFAGTPTVTFDLDTPQFSISGLNPSDPAAFFFDGLYEESQRSAGRDWQARLDATYEFDESFIRSIAAGARYTTRDATREFANRFASFRGRNIVGSRLPLTFATTPEGFVGSDIQGFRSFASPTYDSIRENLIPLRQFVIDNGGNFTLAPIAPRLEYTADEETLAGYVQAGYALGDTVDGVVGVRVVRTETRVAGPTPTGIPSIDDGNQYTDWLPNASIRFRATPEVQLRLAYSKTRTRPNFIDQLPNIRLGAPPPGGVGTDSTPYPAIGGDPFLRPFTSDNYDASLEWYFSRTGFASATLFHRALDGFIQPSSFRFTDPTLGVVEVQGRTNTGKGRITGVEAQLSTFFDFGGLPEWTRNFGIQANVTYLDAETQQTDGTARGLVYDRISYDDGIRNGVSKWNYNLVGLYENEALSARLTYNGRSDFLAFRQFRGGSLANPNPGDLYLEEGNPADRLDLSLNFNVLESATLFFDWTNITNSPFRVDFSSARDGAARAAYPRYLRYDEATLSLGVRFRFGS